MPAPSGPVVVDLQALQSPSFRARGIGRYAQEWAIAVEGLRPDLVGSYLLNPSLPPPGAIEALLATGKLHYADAPDAIGERSRILHSLGPLDTAVGVRDLWPAAAHRAGLALTATVYDCIPALDPDAQLADRAERSRYRVRLELVRAARQLHVLSRAVGDDLRRLLGIAEDRIVVAGAAPSAWFVPPADRSAAAARARAKVPRLEASYVLYPTGNHPRKNNELLVRAWSLLPPAVGRSRQLVLAGDLPASTVHHLEQVAATLGVAGSVVAAGHVDDELLLELYQGAELVCFPSLAEGFGLPVAEALACGTPVVASDRPSLDELLPSSCRFDPEDPSSIASSIAAALAPSAGSAGASSSPPPAPPMRWTEVASRTTAAFDALLGTPLRAVPRARRARVAFVSPLPPSPTGVAAYSYRLLDALQATGEVEIDAFADGPTGQQEAPEGIAVHRARSLVAVELARGGYDAVVYTLGNSHHHLGALAMLRQRRGTVLSHDVRLTNLYRHESGDPGLLPGGLGRAIRAMYGNGLPAGLGDDGAISAADAARYGVLMAREAVAGSDRFLVSSQAAATLAMLDVGTDLAERLAVLPFAVGVPGAAHGAAFAEAGAPAPAGLPRPLEARWGRGASVAGERPIVAHFGIVDPVKDPELLLEAFALARDRLPGALLAYVGPIGDEPALRLARRAAELGVAGDLVLTGPLDPAPYRSWLEQVGVAVQLRRSSNGEASAAVGECLASGVATVVTDLGWASDLPDDAVVKVPAAIGARPLADVLTELGNDGPRRAALAASARAEAARRSFARTAQALLELLVPTRRDRRRDPGDHPARPLAPRPAPTGTARR